MIQTIITNYFTLAVFSAVFAAIANILLRYSIKGTKPKQLLFFTFLSMTLILAIASPWYFHFVVTPISLALILLIVGIDLCANYCYFKTYEALQANVATPLLSMSPGFAFLFSWLFLSEVSPLSNFIIALFIITATVLSSVNWQDLKKIFSFGDKNADKSQLYGLAYGITTAALFGLSAIPSKHLLGNSIELGLINAPTLYFIRASLIALFSALIFPLNFNSIPTRAYPIIIFRSFLVVGQWLCLYQALKLASASIVLTIGVITPALVLLLSVVFLKESTKPRNVFAVAASAALTFFLENPQAQANTEEHQ